MNICIFGASSDRLDPEYFDAAEELGVLMARGGHRLVFGGGKNGLMGACARGLLLAGGHALGIAPRFFDEPGILLKEECDFLFTETMSERKRLMEDRADAFIALPGGIGTYEEFFEALTLKQLGQHNKPMALLNTLGFFDPLETLLARTAEQGFMRGEVCSLYRICESPQEAMAFVIRTPQAPASGRSLSNYSR